MERQGQQGNEQEKGKNESESISRMTQNTISKIRHHHRTCTENKPSCTYHDMKSSGYEWLLPGWVAEERRMYYGRVYKYYYDPEGKLYTTQTAVKAASGRSIRDDKL